MGITENKGTVKYYGANNQEYIVTYSKSMVTGWYTPVSYTHLARPEGFQDAIVKATYDHAVVATEINVKNFNEINT